MQLDKVAHILAGAVIVLALGYTAPVWVAFASALTIGALKVYIDSKGYGTPDFYDFLATGIGATLAALFTITVK